MKKQLISRIDEDLHTKMKIFCTVHNTSITKMVEEAIDLYLRDRIEKDETVAKISLAK